jgi:hypothetical protein
MLLSIVPDGPMESVEDAAAQRPHGQQVELRAFQTLLCTTLALLGELQPLVRQLFVPVFAFLLPTVRNQVQAVC